MQHSLYWIGFGLLALACDAGRSTAAGPSSAPATGGATSQVTLTVSGANPQPVPSSFFGQNYWSWVTAWGDPVASVEPQAKELGIKLLRAGGANNDQQNPERFNEAEIDGFVAYARAIGAEPMLQVPVLKGPTGAAATAQDAAELVRYVNVTRAYGLRYFSIGTDPDLYTEQKFRDASFDAGAACATFSEFAQAMKQVDPNIRILGPELSWKYRRGLNDWLTPFLQGCGAAIDIVAVHRYPFAPEACAKASAYADAEAFRSTIRELRQTLADTGQGAKPLAFTEANITYDGEPTKSTQPASPGTFPAALWLADSLGVALQEGIWSMAYWSLSEGWTLGFFTSDGPRPAALVYKLFARNFGTQVLSVQSSLNGITAYAGRSPEQARSTVFVVNKTDRAAQVLIAASELPRSDIDPFQVPPESVSLLLVPDDVASPIALRTLTAGATEPSTSEL